DLFLNQKDAVRTSPDANWKCVGPNWTNASWGDLSKSCCLDPSIYPHTRYHIRLWKIPYTKANGATFTVGDAHHEDRVYRTQCNINETDPTKVCGAPCHAVDKTGSQGSGVDQG